MLRAAARTLQVVDTVSRWARRFARRVDRSGDAAGTLVTGHERQRQAPARWPATLLRGGVPRVTTRPRPVRGVASAGFHHCWCPPGPCRRTIMTVTAERRSCRCPSTEVRRRCCRSSAADHRPPGRRLAARYANLDYAASAPALRGRRRPRDRGAALYASVHRGAGLRVAGVAPRCTSRPGPDRRPVRRRATGRRRGLHPQHHRRAQPAGRRACPDGGRVLVLDVEHHANLLPWAAARAPRQPRDDRCRIAEHGRRDRRGAAAALRAPAVRAGRRHRRVQRDR